MIVIRKAKREDAEKIREILYEYYLEGIVLERTVSEIISELNHFYTAIDYNDNIVGTVSYHDYGNSLKEIRSLAVQKAFQKAGTGKKLVKFALADILKEEPQAKIFTLTYVPDFFKKMDFYEVDKSTLPEKIWKDCSKCPKKDECGETALVLK